MEHVKVCRICLITEVKMFNLRSYPLCTYLETMIGEHPLSITEMPPYVCYVCITHIQKYYNFRSKCLKGQTALYDIIQANGVITTDIIKQIDREALKLTSNLTMVPQNLTLIINEDMAEIKDEPVMDIENKDYLSFGVNIVKKEDIDDEENDNPLPLASCNDDEEEFSVSVKLDKQIVEIDNRKISMNYQPVYQCNLCYKSFLEARVWKSHTAKHDPMHEENQIDDKLKRKRELTNERVKRHRKKKRTESQQHTEEIQNKQIKENNAERKRALAKERSRRYREKKRLNVSKSVPHVDQDSQIPGLSHEIPPLVLINERNRIHDSQIARTSTNMDVPLSICENHRTTILR